MIFPMKLVLPFMRKFAPKCATMNFVRNSLCQSLRRFIQPLYCGRLNAHTFLDLAYGILLSSAVEVTHTHLCATCMRCLWCLCHILPCFLAKRMTYLPCFLT